jgi:hypothetical protein
MLHCLNPCPKWQPEAQLTPILVIHIRSQKTRCDNRNYMVFTLHRKIESQSLKMSRPLFTCPFVFMIYHHPIISLSVVLGKARKINVLNF